MLKLYFLLTVLLAGEAFATGIEKPLPPMRVIYIPGFGEEPSMFDKIHPHIAGEKIFVDNWKLLADVTGEGFSATVYAQYLVALFHITNADVVIGHSLGGWVAINIKQLTGCRVVQIGSWTDVRRVMPLPINPKIIYAFTRSGLVFNKLTQMMMVKLHYKNQPSKPVFEEVFSNLRTRSKELVVKQLKLIFNPLHLPVTVSPELRIHAKADHIVAYPRTDFVEVPGDHFTLVTHPQPVYNAINDLLQL
ncbi:alpha/beta fold hydrolase [Aridibaculum aurantiacum]|uniref:alpha/beta fold hydrolase n=1 Tax=Aridibaculum aurantiacum TaxID=2810307 RepID=UPI001F6150EE|nr:alpha/beta hydrolase [Aridibaculum aurantiacum]